MRKPFTPEEKEALAANPFTLEVNDYLIRFTLEFKRFLLEERKRNGTPWKEIFRKAGYDPDIFGKTRIDGIVGRIRKEAASEKGLHETGKKAVSAKQNEARRLKCTVHKLEQEVARLQQQIDVLKKTQVIRQLEKAEKKDSADL